MHGTPVAGDPAPRYAPTSATGSLARRIGRTLAWSTGLVGCLVFLATCIWAIVSNG